MGDHRCCVTCTHWGGGNKSLGKCSRTGEFTVNGDSCGYWENVHSTGVAEKVNLIVQALEAIRLLEDAAEKGDADAQYKLALLYFDGKGVQKDSAKTEELINKAAAQGHEQAKEYLAKIEAELAKIEAEKEAFEKLRKVAEQGDVEAQFNLGLAYWDGQGVVRRDSKEAIRWFRKAEVQGNQQAKDFLIRKAKEATKEETHVIKVILIGATIGTVVCGVIGGIIGITSFDPNSVTMIAVTTIIGIWMGLGIGGNISFIPDLFLKPYEWEMFDAFGCITTILWLPCFLILRIVFPLVFVLAGLVASVVAGPVWPLIRFLIKKHEMKEILSRVGF